MSAPTARRRSARTVTAMPTTPAIDRYCELLTALVRDGDARTAPTLFTLSVTLTRHWELLDGLAHLDDGAGLHVEASSVNGITMPERTVPAAQVARAALGADHGALAALLDLPVHRRGRLVEILRHDLAALELQEPVELEQLHLLACEALLEAAPGPDERQGVLAYAGIPAHSPRARRRRDATAPDALAWVAATLDELAQRAGITVHRPHHATHHA